MRRVIDARSPGGARSTHASVRPDGRSARAAHQPGGAAAGDRRAADPRADRRTSSPASTREGEAARRGAFERDKAALRELGVPIETVVLGGDRGRRDGVPDRPAPLRAADLDLTADETRALQLAVAAVRVGGEAGALALLKLGRATATTRRGGAARRRAAGVAVAGRAVRGQRPARHRAVRLPRPDPRRLDPYGLLTRDGFWYVVGLDHGSATAQTFRVDRIEGDVAAGPAGAFDVPAGLRPGRGVPEDPKQLGDGRATRPRPSWRSTACGRQGGARGGRGRGRGRRADGSVVVRVPCANLPAFRSWVLGLLDHAVVLEPAEVRAEVVAWLRRSRMRRSADRRGVQPPSERAGARRAASAGPEPTGRRDRGAGEAGPPARRRPHEAAAGPAAVADGAGRGTVAEAAARFQVSEAELVHDLEVADVRAAALPRRADRPLRRRRRDPRRRAPAVHPPLAPDAGEGFALLAAGRAASSSPAPTRPGRSGGRWTSWPPPSAADARRGGRRGAPAAARRPCRPPSAAGAPRPHLLLGVPRRTDRPGRRPAARVPAGPLVRGGRRPGRPARTHSASTASSRPPNRRAVRRAGPCRRPSGAVLRRRRHRGGHAAAAGGGGVGGRGLSRGRVDPERDGGFVVGLAVASERWLERLLLRAGPEAEVVAPERLAAVGRDAARRLLARYRCRRAAQAGARTRRCARGPRRSPMPGLGQEVGQDAGGGLGVGQGVVGAAAGDAVAGAHSRPAVPELAVGVEPRESCSVQSCSVAGAGEAGAAEGPPEERPVEPGVVGDEDGAVEPLGELGGDVAERRRPPDPRAGRCHGARWARRATSARRCSNGRPRCRRRARVTTATWRRRWRRTDRPLVSTSTTANRWPGEAAIARRRATAGAAAATGGFTMVTLRRGCATDPGTAARIGSRRRVPAFQPAGSWAGSDPPWPARTCPGRSSRARARSCRPAPRTGRRPAARPTVAHLEAVDALVHHRGALGDLVVDHPVDRAAGGDERLEDDTDAVRAVDLGHRHVVVLHVVGDERQRRRRGPWPRGRR